MMLDGPHGPELVQTVARLLRDTLRPLLPPEAAFQARVAANALELAVREWQQAPAAEAAGTTPLLVVVEAEGTRAGILVDDLLAQQQIVIKSLKTNFRAVPGLSGATILGDGTVAMILDVNSVLGLYRHIL